jgi:transposase
VKLFLVGDQRSLSGHDITKGNNGFPAIQRLRFGVARPLKLDRTQRRRLVSLLLQGPMHGYRTNLWTSARIAELIRNQFGIQYHRDHVGRLMHSLNWSPQKPERRALERDENAIERWQERLAADKKTLPGWVPT